MIGYSFIIISNFIYSVLFISSGDRYFVFQILLLIYLLKQFDLTGIDLVQIRAPLVLNRTIPVLRSMRKRIKPVPFGTTAFQINQIGSGDGCSSTYAIESKRRLSRKAEAIRNNQHNSRLFLNEAVYNKKIFKLQMTLDWRQTISNLNH